MIINIRGTNGSGKTTIVKRFLETYPHQEVYGLLGVKRPEAYRVRLPRVGLPLYVIGSYQSATGGCDALPLSANELVGLLSKYQKLGHVLFEGVMISTYYGDVGLWLEAHKDEAIVVFLNTPLHTCLARIKARTGDASRTKNVEAKIVSIESARRRMNEVGIRTEKVSSEKAFEKIVGWLK